ncbi:hypothetical protein [Nocardia flavorosea]|uniref:Uncharacterized protein n=1 Tax=Nocardia flavorosea TaxID=53429 RepID=A0A846YNV1_9NOCA|nr:hypothetical protein [Nocardia flavorosea]NKY60785.1 hypothetical protein [Nocardia flavorosea]
MSERTVATYGEWDEYANNVVDPCARAVGVLADEIRGRVGGNKHVPIWLSEEVETLTGCGDGCCSDESWSYLVIEAGESRARFIDDENEYRYWLDGPLRWAELEAVERARAEQRRANDAAFNAVVITPILDVLQQVEADGYANDGEWHDRVMDALGVGGARYRQG